MSELIVAAQLDSVCRPICPRRGSFNIHLSFQQQLLKFFLFFFLSCSFKQKTGQINKQKTFSLPFHGSDSLPNV